MRERRYASSPDTGGGKRCHVAVTRAIVLGCLVAATSVGCTTNWAERSEAIARDGGATKTQLTGLGFRHVAYVRGVSTQSGQLHIYFGGDGTPMLHRREVSADPTPHQPVALRMMLLDPNPSAYIGRPCYEGLAKDPGCTPALWTLNRYSEAIVASMAKAVEVILADAPNANVSLVGYSGGGVLALLVADRVDRVGQVVTIAANLDTDAWCQLHGYTLLSGSINPMRKSHWRATLRQIHFAGADDRNVPPSIPRAFVNAVPTARLYVVDGFDHRCCWVDDWPTLLTSLDAPASVNRASATRRPAGFPLRGVPWGRRASRAQRARFACASHSGSDASRASIPGAMIQLLFPAGQPTGRAELTP